MKKVRFAIIGLGVVGGRHEQTFARARSRDFCLTAAAEADPDIAAMARRKMNVPIFPSVEELLMQRVAALSGLIFSA